MPLLTAGTGRALLGRSSLLNGLSAAWPLGDRGVADVHGTNHLTANGTIPAEAGLFGNSSRFDSSDWYSVASNATLQTGDIDFTIGAVINRNASGYQNIASKSADGLDEWGLVWHGGDSRFWFWVRETANGNFHSIVESSAGTSTGVWAKVLCWHDVTANTVNINLNGTVYSASTGGAAPTAGAAPLYIGTYRAGTDPWNGWLQHAVIWKRRLSPSEQSRWMKNPVYPFR